MTAKMGDGDATGSGGPEHPAADEADQEQKKKPALPWVWLPVGSLALGLLWVLFSNGSGDDAVEATPATGAAVTSTSTSTPISTPTPSPTTAAPPAAVVPPAGGVPASCIGTPGLLDWPEEKFAAGDWSVKIIVNSAEPWTIEDEGDIPEGFERLLGDDPPPGRYIQYLWQGTTIPANVVIAHERKDAEVTDPVGAIRFSFDTWGAGVRLAPLVIQGDTYYDPDDSGVTTRGGDWIEDGYASECLQPGDFRRLAGDGPPTPDFSKPMRFGYYTASTHSGLPDVEDRRFNVTARWNVQVWQ